MLPACSNGPSSDPGLDHAAAEQIVDYLNAAYRCLLRAAHAGHADRGALLRRGGRHAARDPRALGSRIDRALGLALRKRVLPQVRLRAPGRGDRRRHRALAPTAHSFPLANVARFLVRRRCASRSSRRCSTRRCSGRAGAGSRASRSLSALPRRQEGAAPAHHDARGPVGSCSPTGGVRREYGRPARGARSSAGVRDQCAIASSRRWIAKASSLLEQLERGEIR